MKRWFRIAALVVAVITLGLWAALGAHTGWSMHRVPVTFIDEITGIEGTQWRETWIPGVDFLAIGLAFSSALTVASLLFRARRQ